MENKQKILDALLPALQETRNLHDLKGLFYRSSMETVEAVFKNGTKYANVAGDSGTAMNKDVINQIV